MIERVPKVDGELFSRYEVHSKMPMVRLSDVSTHFSSDEIQLYIKDMVVRKNNYVKIFS